MMIFDQQRARGIKYIQSNWFKHEQVQFYIDIEEEKHTQFYRLFSDGNSNVIKVHIDTQHSSRLFVCLFHFI